jgi:2-aminoethylphosphonate-pyruvate transaminase
MSAFGALPLDAREVRFDAVMASSNKCLEGVPGVGFAVFRTAALEACEGHAASLTLDMYAQYKGFERNGQWRYTPPTHVMAAFDQTLSEYIEEGGQPARYRRYARNHEILVDGFDAMGLSTLLAPELQAPIIVTFLQPEDPSFDFAAFYGALRERGFVIYPGKLTEVDTFRVGCIGQVFPEQMAAFVDTASDVLRTQGVCIPSQETPA